MKVYKTWEMIKGLTENPEKKFRLIDNELDIKVKCSGGEIRWTGDEGLYLEDEWEEVKEPVNFIEAVESGRRIKSEQWDDYQTLDDTLFILARLSRENKRERILGKWYIED